jgi:hypothetical protein
MTVRYTNPVTQYLDDSGDPLISGKLYFYEQGTATPKDTYADAALSIPNSNPVLLTAAGRIPNIFLSGVYKVVLTNSDDVQIWERDSVSGSGSGGSGGLADWDATVTYDVNDLVQGSDKNYYISLSAGNVGNDPTIATSFWTQVLNTHIDATGDGSDAIPWVGQGKTVTQGLDNHETRITDAEADILTNAAAISDNEEEIDKLRPGHLNGLELSVEAATPANDMTMQPGEAAEVSGVYTLQLSSAITKQIDNAWAEGSAVGGFPSGLTLTSGTDYHFFLIGKTDGTVDAGFDSSLTAANLLADAAGYTLYRRIGTAVYIDGTDGIKKFTQTGDDFYWNDPADDKIAGVAPTTATLVSLTTPAGIKTRAIVSVKALGTSAPWALRGFIVDPDTGDPSFAGNVSTVSFGDGGNYVSCAVLNVYTNTASQIQEKWVVDAGAAQTFYATLGYRDERLI